MQLDDFDNIECVGRKLRGKRIAFLSLKKKNGGCIDLLEFGHCSSIYTIYI